MLELLAILVLVSIQETLDWDTALLVIKAMSGPRVSRVPMVPQADLDHLPTTQVQTQQLVHTAQTHSIRPILWSILIDQTPTLTTQHPPVVALSQLLQQARALTVASLTRLMLVHTTAT